jgi:hypothetical protein
VKQAAGHELDFIASCFLSLGSESGISIVLALPDVCLEPDHIRRNRVNRGNPWLTNLAIPVLELNFKMQHSAWIRRMADVEMQIGDNGSTKGGAVVLVLGSNESSPNRNTVTQTEIG